MDIHSEQLTGVYGNAEATALYQEIKREYAFVDFARQFIYSKNERVARNALWILTKTSNQEMTQLQVMLNELMELAMHTGSSSVRRLSLNIIERLELKKEDLRTDFLDFCLERMTDVKECSGIQAVSLKLAFRMCQCYPELMGELTRTLEAMQTVYYKPAVKSVRAKILNGIMK